MTGPAERVKPDPTLVRAVVGTVVWGALCVLFGIAVGIVVAYYAGVH